MAQPVQRDRILSALSAGNVVTVGIQLFRGKSDDYMTTSLQAHLWFFLGLLGTVLTGGIGFALGQSLTRNFETSMFLAILFGLPMLGHSRARLVAAGGLLSRLIFNQLRDRKEPNSDLQKQVFQRKWTYLGAEIWHWILLSLCSLGLIVIVAIFLEFFARFLPNLLSPNSFFPEFANLSQTFLVLVTFVLLVLLFYLALALLFAYITARLWLFDVVVALEEQVNVFQAVQRSWQLTQRHGYRSMTVVLVGGGGYSTPSADRLFVLLCGALCLSVSLDYAAALLAGRKGRALL
ncbi:MAG: hypothetical protein HC934_00910 [Acaryochloridaceae cyanobacterium SU_2_1]|nr:hypothetical protein [Acaryochloridaceae cyanobacterium SU_2_1]